MLSLEEIEYLRSLIGAQYDDQVEYGAVTAHDILNHVQALHIAVEALKKSCFCMDIDGPTMCYCNACEGVKKIQSLVGPVEG